MRRRRQKNTLLPKMIGIAVAVNAILLPILAQFGVFKMGHGQRLTPIQLVKLPPLEKKPVQPKRRIAKTKPHPAEHKAAAHLASARPSRPNPNQPKVVASTGNTGAGPAIENNGTEKPGQVALPSAAASQIPPSPAPTPVPAPVPMPIPAPPKVAAIPAPPLPHVPVLIPAEPIAQPHPTLPDDLRDTDLQATFRALFTIHKDGTASVKMVSSTGSPTLDELALAAARQWTFRPATEDGVPVESFCRLKVEFEVS